ncbi:DUF4034 domain-containing protein [Micromonospora globispora]|uniref:DUF4034 domain-containing protein n=1 Tax=Micromonospora globispora TaxID=1450148 RepID=A0A317KHW8_9ACTN|nr:DUF4034 domain-containing protein [Micromonospora globispora]PWU53258.1 DUF4034 domain-containing protein [Micromonospora globispora]PWU60636.1 DUF4034 domain-containing protein [Micromonospora globispora]RQW84925.1 DUF4034 domain-containing protein [Micromonospora globispora]
MWPFRRKAKQSGPVLPVDPAMGDPTAHALHEALSRRDWRTARDVLLTITDPDHHALCLNAAARVQGVQEWIGEWVEAEPRSTLPLLVRGTHGVHWAWEARGGAWAARTSQEQFREFRRRLTFAENCLDEVAERDPEDTTARAFLVASARGRQVDRDEAARRFADVVARHPWHRYAHVQMLQYRCAKWFGSHEEMFDLARTTAAEASPASGLAHLVSMAHLEMWLKLPYGEDDQYLQQAEVLAELRSAADRSVRHPEHGRYPGWPAPHNNFAMCFALGGDHAAAAEQFRAIGDLVTELPWSYLDGRDPGAPFTQWREKVTGGQG